MNMLEAKAFDENAENWKRENRLFTSTVLSDGAKSNLNAHIEKPSNILTCYRCSNSCFLVETGNAGR